MRIKVHSFIQQIWSTPFTATGMLSLVPRTLLQSPPKTLGAYSTQREVSLPPGEFLWVEDCSASLSWLCSSSTHWKASNFTLRSWASRLLTWVEKCLGSRNAFGKQNCSISSLWRVGWGDCQRECGSKAIPGIQVFKKSLVRLNWALWKSGAPGRSRT